MSNEDLTALQAVAEQAADWLLRLEDEDATATEAELLEFSAWLQRSPLHIEEFLQVSALHAELSSADEVAFPAVQILVDAARLNVVDIASTDEPTQAVLPPERRRVRLRRIIGGAAGAVLLAMVTQHFVIDPADFAVVTTPGQTFSTDVGEQRSVVLADGSVVNMNTRSTLNVRFTQASRVVELTAGEAMFDVHKNASRPFLVKSGRSVVEAVGTRFNVYRQDKQTVVTVVEGNVAVSSHAARTSDSDNVTPITGQAGKNKRVAVVRLQPGGQVAVLKSGDISATRTVDSSKATAWTERRLVFDAEPLQLVARELNRYNHRRVSIGDVSIASRSISGVFNASDPETLLAFLKTVGDIRVEPDPATDGWVLYQADSRDSD